MANSSEAISMAGRITDDLKDAVMRPIRGFIDAMDARTFESAKRFFVDQPSIVDAFAPYHWTGVTAIERWATGVEAAIARSTILDYSAEVLGIRTIVIEGNRAYASIDLCYTLKMSDQKQPVLDKGVFTYALERSVDGWKIAAATWAGGVTI